MLGMLEFCMTKRRRQFPKLNFPRRPGRTFSGRLQKIHVFIFLAGRKTNFTVHVSMLIAHTSLCASSGEMSWRNSFCEHLSDCCVFLHPSAQVSQNHFSFAAVAV